MTDTDLFVTNYFGGCPRCGQTDGYINVVRSHWFVCNEHRTKWNAGANLFSSWREEDEQTWAANAEKLNGYTMVVALPCNVLDLSEELPVRFDERPFPF